jgi:hypothetical protein
MRSLKKNIEETQWSLTISMVNFLNLLLPNFGQIISIIIIIPRQKLLSNSCTETIFMSVYVYLGLVCWFRQFLLAIVKMVSFDWSTFD